MYANNIEIQDIYFPDSDRKYFPHLKWLSINYNRISEVYIYITKIAQKSQLKINLI